MADGSITYFMDQLPLWIEGRKSCMDVYADCSISFDTEDNELNVYSIELRMEDGGKSLDLLMSDPLFGLIRDTLLEHYADSVWSRIRDEYPEFFHGDVNAEHRLSGRQLGIGRAA